ncbi:peptidoglycan DD-metalloendopeptidase family protein [uncultured Winogradskyella sp.]|uniref:peptidoglycan DD-metalloendopeptidase family protein n=1 Tax=uncultured Winogradskyella sp. TaxID=395353 RepID=UPI00261D2152|nr:peptidoglycan DD-metalloendopeptidase family protein [uncultured Winogradskyella sp.]
MKSKTTLLILILLSVYFCNAQTPDSPIGGGEFVFNPERKACLTPEQRSDIGKTLQTNIKKLQLQNRLSFKEVKSGNHPLFIWPIQKASNIDYNDVWAISGYVDHDLNFNNNLLDYNCGSITYDTSNYNHQGIDIYNWPFTWKLMDDDGVEIIAAAAGQIVAKSDGEFDRSCDFNTTTPWNAVYVQHSDGSVALYGHMKNGSTTSKNVGDMVSEGEYLGIVGSSGISTGPHLHMEVYQSIVNNTLTDLIDPYSGTCNSLNTDSWWANQKPYVNSNINAIMTHSQAPNVFPACPTTETTYENSDFDISEDIYLSAFLRDQIANTPLSLKVIRPNGSYLYDWSINTTTTSSSWYYYWFFPVDALGTWTWEVTYQGQTETYDFNVTDQLGIEDETLEGTSIYPNPFDDIVNVNSTAKIKKASVVDILGKTILIVNKNSDEGIKELNLADLSNGMYFVTLEGEQQQKKTIKLIKK